MNNHINLEKKVILEKLLQKKDIELKNAIVTWGISYEQGCYEGVVLTQDEQIFQFEIFCHTPNHFELVSWLDITESVYENIDEKSRRLDLQQEKYKTLALLREINGTNCLRKYLNYEIIPFTQNNFLREVVRMDYQHVYLIPSMSNRLLHWWNQIEPIPGVVRAYKSNSVQRLEKISVQELLDKLNNEFIKQGLFFIQINREVPNLDKIISCTPSVRYEKLKESGMFLEVFLPMHNEYGRVVCTDKLYLDKYAQLVDEKLFFLKYRGM